jgi:hypothetical protein
MPKVLKDMVDVNYIGFTEFRSSKEASDKIIGMMAQKAISSGYTDIYLVSKDCDFPDIARMLAGLNSDCKNIVKLNVIMPEVKNRAKNVNYSNTNHGNISVYVYWIKRKLKGSV